MFHTPPHMVRPAPTPEQKLEKAIGELRKLFGLHANGRRAKSALFDALLNGWADALDNPSPALRVVEIRKEV